MPTEKTHTLFLHTKHERLSSVEVCVRETRKTNKKKREKDKDKGVERNLSFYSLTHLQVGKEPDAEVVDALRQYPAGGGRRRSHQQSRSMNRPPQ